MRVDNAVTAGDGMPPKASRPNPKAGSQSETDGTKASTSGVHDVPLTGSKAPNAHRGQP